MGKTGDSRRVRCSLVDLCPREIAGAEKGKEARRAKQEAVAVLRSRPVLLFDLGIGVGAVAMAR